MTLKAAVGEHAIEHLPVAPSLRDRTGLTIVANLNGDIRPTRPWRPSKIRIGDRVRGYTPGFVRACPAKTVSMGVWKRVGQRAALG